MDRVTCEVALRRKRAVIKGDRKKGDAGRTSDRDTQEMGLTRPTLTKGWQRGVRGESTAWTDGEKKRIRI